MEEISQCVKESGVALHRKIVVRPTVSHYHESNSGLCPNCDKKFASRESMVHHYTRFHSKIEVFSSNMKTSNQLKNLLEQIKLMTGREMVVWDDGEDCDLNYACDLIRTPVNDHLHIDAVPTVVNCTAFLSTRTKRNRTIDVRYCIFHSHSLEKVPELLHPERLPKQEVEAENISGCNTVSAHLPTAENRSTIHSSLRFHDYTKVWSTTSCTKDVSRNEDGNDVVEQQEQFFVVSEEQKLALDSQPLLGKQETIEETNADFHIKEETIEMENEYPEIPQKRPKIENSSVDYKAEYDKLKAQLHEQAVELGMTLNYRMERNAKEVISSVHNFLVAMSQSDP